MGEKVEEGEKIEFFLRKALELKASDLHLAVGNRAMARVDGIMHPLSEGAMTKIEVQGMIKQLLTGRQELEEQLLKEGQVDFAYERYSIGRMRVNVYRQQGGGAIALRLLQEQIPTMQQLGLPTLVMEKLAGLKRGLILVTGPTGSGKTSTLASLLDYMNETRFEHLLTLEDPIEYVHAQKRCLISQREIGKDACSYQQALRAALREDPDVILVGEMRDLETIAIAITAAETGHLVLSSLHTIGAAQTIDRIVDVFPADQQQYMRLQIANVLKAVISQQLLPRCDSKGRCAALEIMVNNHAIANMIRENKTHQIYSQIQTGFAMGMMTMEESMIRHYREGKISEDMLYQYSQNKEEVRRMLLR